MAAIPDTRQPSTIGGWLILFGIGLALTPLRVLAKMILVFGPIDSERWAALTTPGSPDYAAHWKPLLLCEFGSDVVLLLWPIVLIYLLLTRRRLLVPAAIVYMVVSLGVAIADLTAVQLVVGAQAAADRNWVRPVALEFVSACVWIPYLLTSRRVKATLFH
ncbi:MAG: DUF2569 family protein [Candidatus Rokuibacteriota bacterium]